MKVGDFVREIESGSSRDLEAGLVVEIMHFPANDYAPIQFRLIPLGESKPTLHQRNARFYEVINESR
jgi:hypothetical protein